MSSLNKKLRLKVSPSVWHEKITASPPLVTNITCCVDMSPRFIALNCFKSFREFLTVTTHNVYFVGIK